MLRTKLRYLIIFYGRPGCGKGTNAKNLAAMLGIPIFSGSDALIEYIADPTTPRAEVRYIRYCMKKGFLVMDKVMVKAFAYSMAHAHFEAMIFDGVPRTPEQAPWLNLEDTVRVVFHLELTREEALKRSADRLAKAKARKAMADAAGEILARDLLPRFDDEPEEANRRQDTFDKMDPAMTAALETLASPGCYLRISAHDEDRAPEARQVEILMFTQQHSVVSLSITGMTPVAAA